LLISRVTGNLKNPLGRFRRLSGPSRFASELTTSRLEQARSQQFPDDCAETAYHSSMPRTKILRLLKGGDGRSIGRADEVAAAVSKNLAMFPELMKGLWSEDPLVRIRAADATEKITRSNPDLLRPYRRELLGLMAEAQQQELRWHLAAMVPRLE